MLKIDQTNVEEKFNIEVEGAIGANYVIQFVNPKYDPESDAHAQFWKTEDIVDNCSAATMRTRLYDYYANTWGTDISVTKTDYDSAGLETSDSSLVTRSVYEVTVLKRINGPSYSSAAVLQEVAGATITLDMPW